ncbi:hypothetical protein [Streptosporangium subroseum]|nr:hypothetical protein OHB15_24395 [Streptosporangium subroseum]
MLGTIVAVVYMLVSGDAQNVQTSYQAAAAVAHPGATRRLLYRSE